MKPNSRDLSARDRFQILARNNFRCQYCGDRPGNAELQVDHLIPWAKGGATTYDNLATSCAKCNNGKSDQVCIPECLLHDLEYDCDGFQTWKDFGSWSVKVDERTVVLECTAPLAHGYWIDASRVFETHDGWDWETHLGRKDWCQGTVWIDLAIALGWLRSVVRREGAPC